MAQDLVVGRHQAPRIRAGVEGQAEPQREAQSVRSGAPVRGVRVIIVGMASGPGLIGIVRDTDVPAELSAQGAAGGIPRIEDQSALRPFRDNIADCAAIWAGNRAVCENPNVYLPLQRLHTLEERRLLRSKLPPRRTRQENRNYTSCRRPIACSDHAHPSSVSPSDDNSIRQISRQNNAASGSWFCCRRTRSQIEAAGENWQEHLDHKRVGRRGDGEIGGADNDTRRRRPSTLPRFVGQAHELLCFCCCRLFRGDPFGA